MLERFRKFLRRERDDAAQLEQAQRKMIDRDLAGRGIKSQRVLDSMARIPREHFLPPSLKLSAYEDRALPIACGQTISQPYIVALMTELLDVARDQHVLEVGTGSGYQAAILADLAQDLVTIERRAELSNTARRLLAELGYTNVHFIVGDGSLGWPAGAPYDRILITAAAARPPPALLEQLADGGVLVAPLGSMAEQQIVVVHKVGDRLHERAVTPCRFVPLIGRQGFPDNPDA